MHNNNKNLKVPMNWYEAMFLGSLKVGWRYYFLKKGFRSEYTIYRHFSDKSWKCMSVDNSGILSAVVVSVLTPAHISLYRCLEYLLKVRYIIIVDSNGAGFLILEIVFLGR